MDGWKYLFIVTLTAFIGGLILDLGWFALGLWFVIVAITSPTLAREEMFYVESPERG